MNRIRGGRGRINRVILVSNMRMHLSISFMVFARCPNDAAVRGLILQHFAIDETMAMTQWVCVCVFDFGECGVFRNLLSNSAT